LFDVNVFGVFKVTHAIEAFSDTLNLEMQRFDVKTSVIQPGNYKSDILKSRVARRAEENGSAEE
jgi:NAD(P)-dependent dehydrogenase (short-subunit alcohol dehydrogenase family)